MGLIFHRTSTSHCPAQTPPSEGLPWDSAAAMLLTAVVSRTHTLSSSFSAAVQPPAPETVMSVWHPAQNPASHPLDSTPCVYTPPHQLTPLPIRRASAPDSLADRSAFKFLVSARPERPALPFHASAIPRPVPGLTAAVPSCPPFPQASVPTGPRQGSGSWALCPSA